MVWTVLQFQCNWIKSSWAISCQVILTQHHFRDWLTVPAKFWTHWNNGVFEPPDTTLKPRLYWILSPRKLQDICNYEAVKNSPRQSEFLEPREHTKEYWRCQSFKMHVILSTKKCTLHFTSMLHMILLLATVPFKTINHSNILCMLSCTVGPYAPSAAMYGLYIYKGMNFNAWLCTVEQMTSLLHSYLCN
jgi:hypothetical protein